VEHVGQPALNWKFHGGLDQVADNHLKLLDALATNDPRIAEQEMLSHVIVEKMIAALQGGKTKKTSGEPSG
jgi:DNA-binding FadR family transcriptional regulator